MKYELASEIPDKEIKNQFERNNQIDFLSASFNYLENRKITFGNLGWWIPITRVLSVIGITPQMMKKIFLLDNDLPEVIETFEDLGSFRFSEKAFQELSQVLEKSVRVFKENGWTSEYYLLFTVNYPSGKIAT